MGPNAILEEFVDKIRPIEIALPYTLQYCEKKKCVCMISDVYDTVKCSLQKIFDRCYLQAWHNVVAMVANIQLTNQMDRFLWGLHQNGLFSVKLMYRALLGTQALPFNTFIWKLKLPLKIKVFMWYLYEGIGRTI
jgi:hypothetical protein